MHKFHITMQKGVMTSRGDLVIMTHVRLPLCYAGEHYIGGRH